MRAAWAVIASLVAAGVSIGVAVAVPSGDAGLRSASVRSGCTPVWSNAPNPQIKEGTLASVAARSASDAWAVGGVVRRDEYGEEIVSASPLIEHWDGKSWSVVANPKVSGSLTDVAATSRHDAWAVGWEGQDPRSAAPLMLHWDGRRWSRVTLPAAVRDTSAVAALSSRDVWIVGTSGTPYPEVGEISHWNGRQWTHVTKRPASLADIAAISRDDVWAVGNTVEPSDWDKALMMHWNGVRWKSFVRKATSGNDYAWLSAVGVASKDDVWAGGGEHMAEMSPPAIGPLMLHWDGKRWTYARLPGAGETEFSGIAPAASGEVPAVSENSYNMDPPYNGGGIGSWTWHRAGNRWSATELRGGRMLKDIAAVATRRRSAPLVWAVGEAGTAPADYEGYFPAHTMPLIRRFGC